MSNDVLSMWTIFWSSGDGVFVLRRFEAHPGRDEALPTDDLSVHPSLEDARLAVPCECVLIPRSPEDDPAVVENWL